MKRSSSEAKCSASLPPPALPKPPDRTGVDTGSPTCARVDELLASDLAVCDPVQMEVLAGARDGRHLTALRGLLARASVVATGPAQYDEAAAMYRACRKGGETVRRLVDCLIAASAVAVGVPVLHADADFDVLARHTALQVDRR